MAAPFANVIRLASPSKRWVREFPGSYLIKEPGWLVWIYKVERCSGGGWGWVVCNDKDPQYAETEQRGGRDTLRGAKREAGRVFLSMQREWHSRPKRRA